jgi:hypothetical protein
MGKNVKWIGGGRKSKRVCKKKLLRALSQENLGVLQGDQILGEFQAN